MMSETKQPTMSRRAREAQPFRAMVFGERADEMIARSEAKTIQLLATDSAQRAREEASRLSQKFGTPITIVSANQVYRLHMGPMAPQQAEVMLAVVKDAGLNSAYFVY